MMMKTKTKWRVHGYALCPVEAETTVEADSPEEALSIARQQWASDKRSLIVHNSSDEGAAEDWDPIAEPELTP